MSKRTVCIVGHKNPDTDSICSAISYAYLKNQAEPDEELKCVARALLPEEISEGAEGSFRTQLIGDGQDIESIEFSK